MANSYQKVVSDGTLTFVDISIGYLDRDDISVYFNQVLTTGWMWSGDTDKRILFPSAVAAGVEVQIRRITDASNLRHQFTLGAAFTSRSLDEDLKQALYISQEAQEANLVGDFFTNVDLHGYRLLNIGPAVSDTDALTLGQYKADALGANTAAATATAAATSAVAAAASANAVGTGIRSDLLLNLANKGSAMISFLASFAYQVGSVGWGIITASRSYNIMRDIPVSEWPAIKNYTSTLDLSAIVQTAVNRKLLVYFPPGLYNFMNVNIPPGALGIVGDSIQGTVFRALQVAGSVIKRINAAGQYVAFCRFADYTIALNHKPMTDPNRYDQIGMDMVDFTRCTLDRIMVTNVLDSQVNPNVQFSIAFADIVQGIGFRFGTTSGASYCGGEENVLTNCKAWDLFRNFLVDHNSTSGAHGTSLIECEAQGGHELMSQNSAFTSNLNVFGMTLQNLRRRSGYESPTYAINVAGYGATVHFKYIESGVACDHVWVLASTSHECTLNVAGYSYTSPSTGLRLDTGTQNTVHYDEVVPSGNDWISKGRHIHTYNRAPLKGEWVGKWAGGTGIGTMTDIFRTDCYVVRATSNPGDYWFYCGTPQPNPNWIPDAEFEINSSGNPGSVSWQKSSQTVDRIRFFVYSNQTNPPTPVDPVTMWLSFEQAI